MINFEIINIENLRRMIQNYFDDDNFNFNFLKKFNETIEIMERLYKENKKWIVAYSGGKDSTTVVLIALYMKSIHRDINLQITYSDTLMEIPLMSKVAYSFLEFLNEEYPGIVTIVYPDIEDRFWVRMIGRGYPPPGPRFRWCTDKIKIKPARKIHNDDGIFITGMRIGESLQRDTKLKDSCLINNSTECGNKNWIMQKGIYVTTPIINWTDEDVWFFLKNFGNKIIPKINLVIDLYKERPLRFGCWMCSVVEKDKTMLELARYDYKIRKLLDFKEWIIKESKKIENRYIKKNGKLGRMKKEFRWKILKNLINLQKELNIQLISNEEIKRIEELLNSEFYGEY
jgi:DNA sulfur modification protein DndC